MQFTIDETINAVVYKVNLVLRNRFQSSINDFGITTEQWGILSRLYLKDGYNQKELSKESFKEQAAITRTLDLLEAKELIERRKSPNDRREFLIFITDKGRTLYEKTLPAASLYQQTINTILDNEERNTLVSLLNKLLFGLMNKA